MSYDPSMDTAGGALADKLGYWSEHPDYPVTDWQYNVREGNTRLGYWAWIASNIEANQEHDNALSG
jgi:hypothetical protein